MRLSIVIGIMAALAGCATAGLQQDGPIQLGPDQGLAGIVMNAPTRITQISFAAKDPGGKKFEVPDTQGGWTLYLIPVKAGRYCLQHFRLSRIIFDSVQDLGCFTVLPGHITYSGDMVPSIGPDEAVTDHQFNPTLFVEALHKLFPILAGTYPLAAPTPPPAGTDATSDDREMSTWVQDVPVTGSQAVYVKNNTSWSVKITDFSLTACMNIKQACVKTPMDTVVAPFQTRQIVVIEPAQPNAAYSYRYDYHYDDVD